MINNHAIRLFLANNARGGKTAIVDKNISLTFAELSRFSRSFATQLKQLGLLPQSRVLFYFDDSAEWVVAFLGCLLAGLNPVGVDFRTNQDQLNKIIDLVDARAVISDQPINNHTISVIARNRILDIFDPIRDDQCYDFHPDEFCFWYSTSGTTGRPKSVVHRHDSFANHGTISKDIWNIDEQSRLLNGSKLSFAYGIYPVFMMGLPRGATIYLLDGVPAPSRIFDHVNKFGISHLFLVPGVVNALIKHAHIGADRFGPDLQCVVSSGESLPPLLIQNFNDQFGIKIRNSFGTTECSAMTFTPMLDNYEIDSMGSVMPGHEVKLLDENQKPVSDGTPGELWIKCNSMACCYWKDSQWSRHSFVGQWFRTGDIVVKTTSNNYKHISRIDDFIKINGQWVAATEIESSLQQVQGIDDAAVIFEVAKDALPKIHAFVVTKDKSIDKLHVERILMDRLPSYKMPKHYHFIDNIPRTLTNKKMKYMLSNRISEIIAKEVA